MDLTDFDSSAAVALRRHGGLLVLCFVLLTPALGIGRDHLAIEDFARLSAYVNVQFSPDGHHLAIISHADDPWRVVILP